MNLYSTAIARARADRRPLPAFNVVDLGMVKGVVSTASRLGVPVIVQASARTAAAYGPSVVRDMIRSAAASAGVDVFVHLDHCHDEALLDGAIRAGFDGIMVDGSHLSYADNVEFTRKWVATAHSAGILVEGELGAIQGIEEGVGAAGTRGEYTAHEVIEFAVETGVDLVGTDVGTAHGLYQAPPEIRYDLISGIVEGSPAGFVVHGGSGLDRAALGRLSACGVAKVNFSTDLKVAWNTALRGLLMECDAVVEPLAAVTAVESAVATVCEEKIAALHGPAGGGHPA